MNLSESVFEISEMFMTDPEYVEMNKPTIEYIADIMLETGKTKFKLPDIEDIYKGVMLELVASSVNYCYWYGKSTIRPLGANSTKMYNLLLLAFENYDEPDNFQDCIHNFSILLSQNRFPLLEERIKHLEELVKYNAEEFVNEIISRNTMSANEVMLLLISMFPGFASDIFLKRASLFIIELFRRFGWFSNDLKKIHVPPDYQVPKMLNSVGCISYNYSLQTTINNNELISKGSVAECEIRAATVLTIKKLCELTDWNVAEVDAYFFLRRYESTDPFHLTITTDY